MERSAVPNRRLSSAELEKARELLDSIRGSLNELSGGDPDLLFAYRRKVYKELTYDERDTPAFRRKLKAIKRREQSNICPICQQQLPEKYCVLDRFEASARYTIKNTRLICPTCDVKVQASRKYA
jgi:hypothetical protein